MQDSHKSIEALVGLKCLGLTIMVNSQNIKAILVKQNVFFHQASQPSKAIL